MSKHGAERSEKTLAFLSEIVDVSRRHGLSLSHEDSQGGFLVEPLDERNIDWLLLAYEPDAR